jgi:hypothetical protein
VILPPLVFPVLSLSRGPRWPRPVQSRVAGVIALNQGTLTEGEGSVPWIGSFLYFVEPPKVAKASTSSVRRLSLSLTFLTANFANVHAGNTKGGQYHCTIGLLFDWLGISCTTTDYFCFHLQNRLIPTGQTGGQQYSDTSPFSIPWYTSLCNRLDPTRPDSTQLLFLSSRGPPTHLWPKFE